MTDELEKLQRKGTRPAPASIECQSEIDKDLVRTYYGDLGAFYRVRAAIAATPAEPIAWRWRTLPKFSEDAADQEWELTPNAPSFINPHHHEVEPLYTAVVAAAPAVGGEREALIDACMRLQAFLDTFGDVGGCETQADLNDWLAAPPASPLREAFGRLERRLMSYCNHANAGHIPSDAREFARRVQLGFMAAYGEADITPPTIDPETEAEYMAALPASPLRGSEVLASISRAVYRIREWAKNEGPYSEIIKEAAIIERRIEQIALASPPEQPKPFKPCAGCYTAAECQKANHCFGEAEMHASGRTKAGNDISGI